ncbi:prealbumin-like fold domain-containing protein [Agromyces humi]|uniref:prealbumin-like fold domain-containing protein n=1 Tax=Agromyces humi TaxID=1766800 RepID=UPI002E272119
MAVDLTASNLLPSDGACRTFLDAGFITRTGNNETATLQDMLKSSNPLTITNCGSLVVKKVANPADATSDDVFDYTVTRTGGGIVHDGTLTGPVLPQGNNNAIAAPIGVGDTHTWGNVFAGTDYQLAETVDSGQPWVHQSTVCTVTNPSTNQVETYTNQPFKLFVGATTTCVITNSTSGVKITKVAQGDPTTFDFAINGTPVKVDGGTSSPVTSFVPGSTVTINEFPEPGTPAWHLTALTCSTPATTTLATGTAVVTTVAGQITECTFTNRQDGAIRIIKNVAGANGTFDFTTTIPGGPFQITTTGDVKTGSKDFTSVAPGDYTVTETTPAPAYDLTSLSCTDDATGVASTGDVATGVASIHLEPGELVTCTYTNTQRGNIIVKKETNPDGSTTSFDFTLTGQPGFALKDGGEKAFNQVKPGAYTLTEAALAGWDVTSMTCTSENPTTDSPINITLDPGETVTCTVLNTATRGEVTVTKHVEGADDWAFQIGIDPVPGGQQNPKTLSDETPTAKWTDLIVGQTYTLSEPTVAGYTTQGFTCNVGERVPGTKWQFTVTPGLVVTCDLTNVATPGEVTVTKTVAGVASGTDWEFDLTITPSAGVTPGATQTVSGSGNTTDSVTWKNLDVGTEYTITEKLPAGWTGGGVDCGPDSNPNLAGDQFIVTPGFTLSCTVLNTAAPGSAKITKTSVGASGTFTFVLTPLAPAGAPVEQMIATPAGGGSAETTFANLVPGTTYSLAEKNPGNGWVAGELVCTVKHAGSDASQPVTESGFTVQAGDVFACDITNTAKGKIIVVKNIDGADGTFQFTGTWPWAGDPSIGSFGVTTSGGVGANTYDNVVAGSYSVTELLTNTHVGQLVGCVESRAGGADGGSSIDQGNALKGLIDLDPGETITCTYSNTELSTIIIDKVVPGVGSIPGGASVAFPFTFDAPNAPAAGFTLTDGDPAKVFGQLLPGTYTVNESATTDWKLQGLACSPNGGVEVTDATADITLAAGQTVTCTYTNVPESGDVTVRKIVEGVPQGYPFDFAITISPVVTGQDATQHVTQGDSSVSWNDLVVGQTYTLTEGDVGGWNEGDFVCNGGDVEDADAQLAGFQFLVTPGLSLGCTITNTAEPGDVTVTKHVAGVPDGFEWAFPLTISPADGVLPGAEQAVSGTGDETDSVTWTNLAIGTVYTVTEGDLPVGWTGGAVVCTDMDPQTTGNQFVATPGASLTCEVTNDVVAPTGVITKDLTSIEQNTDGTWDLVYEVTVTNQSPVAPLVYDLDDEPYFGVGVVINDSSATGPSDEADDWDAEASNFVLARDTSVAASGTDTYIVTINATVPEQVYETSQDRCQPGDTEPGGFRNTAFLTVGEGEPQAATACDEPGRTTVTKEVVGSPENLGNGDWKVVYQVVVTSESADLDLYYDLEDELGFPAGVVIDDGDAVATNDAGVDTSDWNGDDVTVLADDELIAPLDVHTYTITVVANVVNVTELDDVTCLASTSGHGFFNGATLVNGTIVTDVDACATIPVGRIQLQKTVDNSALEAILSRIDLGGVTPGSLSVLTPGDWNLTGENAPKLETLLVKGDSGLVFTVPTGDYSLLEKISEAKADSPLLAYYFNGDWLCGVDGGAKVDTGDVGTVTLGHLTSCAVENEAESVDVSLEKTYELAEGATAVDAGDEFDYVLTVRNNGTLPVSELDIADTIDARFAITGAAAFDGLGSWSESTVGNEFAAHGVGPFAPGDVVTVRIPVTMLQPAPVEAPGVVGPNDPPPVVEPVDLGDIPNAACVAITPTEGALADLISTNDCDDVDVPQKAIDAGAYPRCVNDVPYLYLDIKVSDSVTPGPITVTWVSGDGTLTYEVVVPWEDRNEPLLWPGAAVDANGIPYQFPGWRPITEQDLITPPTPGTRFLDLILDETVPTYPWRDMVNPATVTFSINPSQAVLVTYPQALPACAIVRPPDLDIEKTASVSSTAPGGDYEYTLKVTSVGTGGAEPVEIFDAIPTDLRVDSISTAPAPAFPRWEDCQVTGTDSAGYGGVLHCDLLGVLGPNLTTAPPITLDVHVNPASHATSISNTGEVCWDDADAPADAEAVIPCADDTVDVPVKQAAIASTGFDVTPFAWGGGVLALLGAVLVGMTIIRRRREGRIRA